MYVVLCCCFSASARLPIYSAYYFFYVAYCFILRLLNNSPFFLVGGFPSNTQTGLIPFSINKIVRLKIPNKCPVLFPYESVSVVRKLASCDIPCVCTKN